MRKRSWAIIFTLASFTVPFIVYLRTLSPSVNFGDTGELITAAYTLGIPHPPGFPIWCLLAKIFTLLPIKTIAWRVNLSSAAFSAATIGIIFLISKTVLALLVPAESSGKRNKLLVLLSAFTASLIFAFTKDFWSGAVSAEVYPLNALFSALILFWTLRWFEKREAKYLYLLSFTYGLGLTNHYLILLLAPPLVLWFILFERGILKNWKLLLSLAIFFLLGLSFFLYLPIRSRANPLIDWGNPETLENFLAHIGREQFARTDKSGVGPVSLPIAPSSSWLDLVYRGLSTFWVFLTILSQTFSPLLVIVGFAGGVFLLIENRKLFFLLLFLFLTAGWGYIFARYTRISPEEGLFSACVPAFLFFVPFLAAGFFSTLKILKKLPRLLFPALLFLPLIPLYQNFDANDWSQNFVARDHARNLLQTVEEDALIFAEENSWLFPILYLSMVEGERPDVTIYDRNGNLFDDVYKEAKKEYITEENFEVRRRRVEEGLVAESGRPAYYAVDKTFENYRYVGVEWEGVLYRQGKAQKIDFAERYQNILAIEDRGLGDTQGNAYIIAHYHLRFGDILQQEGKSKEALREYEKAFRWGKNDSHLLNNLAVTYINLGEDEKAREILEQVFEFDPKNAIAHNILGTIYEELGETEKAMEEYRKALESNSKYLGAVINLTALYEKEGNFEKAFEGYQIALSLKPSDEELRAHVNKMKAVEVKKWFEEGMALTKEEDYSAAIEKYEQAIALNPLYPEAYNNLGVCHARMGDFDKAKEAWEKALTINPQSREAIENLKLLEGVVF